MDTKLLPPTDENLAHAAQLLQGGQLVAFPTETVYGLGANALDAQAVLSIFTAKRRPADNPLIVHVDGKNTAQQVCQWSDAAQQIADAFWPGPLTMLLPRKACVPQIVTAGLPTVGVRFSNHPVAIRLIAQTGLPLAAPSANLSGRPSPTLAAHVMEDFCGTVPMIIDGGECAIGIESTVVDMSGEAPTVLRPGAVTPEQIAMVMGACNVAPAVRRALLPGESAPSPGMRHRHYAPRAAMTLVKGDIKKVADYINDQYDRTPNAAVLAFAPHMSLYGARNVINLGLDATSAAHKLFYVLRQLDAQGVEYIYSETLPETGLGLAVMNRLARAAAFHLVDVDTLPPPDLSN